LFRSFLSLEEAGNPESAKDSVRYHPQPSSLRPMDRRSRQAIKTKAPEHAPGLFCCGYGFQVRVRIRIMKLSKLSSATCIHIRESLR
jgi:hypothetical protein